MAETATIDAPASIVSGGESTTTTTTAPPTWLDAIPEHYDGKDAKGAAIKVPLRGDKSLASFKTVDELARSYIETKALVGKKTEGVKAPGAEATPEEKAAFRKAIGAATSVDDLKDVKLPEVEGVTFDEKGVQQFKELAVREGFSLAQTQAAMNFAAEWQGQLKNQMVSSWIDQQEDLRKEWGVNFPRQVALAKRGAEYAIRESKAGDEIRQILVDSGLEEHPGIVKMFAWIGRNLAEDGLVAGHDAGGYTNEELDAKIKALEADPIFKNPGDPKRAALMEEREALYRARYGNTERNAKMR